MNAYVDRGIIKWNAFDALAGYTSMLDEMRYRLGRKERPVLSDDAYEEMERQLRAALSAKAEVEIKYHRDGYVRFTYGKIHKVDYTTREIVLSTWERLKAEDILEITLQ
jgi:hypothetical protein